MGKEAFVLPGLPGTCHQEGRQGWGSKSPEHLMSCSSVPHRFQKLHLACGSEHLILHSPLQPPISLCEAPSGPLQLPGGNVTITYSYAGARAPMGQGFLLTYSQGRLNRVYGGTIGGEVGVPQEEARILGVLALPCLLMPLQIGYCACKKNSSA